MPSGEEAFIEVPPFMALGLKLFPRRSTSILAPFSKCLGFRSFPQAATQVSLLLKALHDASSIMKPVFLLGGWVTTSSKKLAWMRPAWAICGHVAQCRSAYHVWCSGGTAPLVKPEDFHDTHHQRCPGYRTRWHIRHH